jgi:hypothetical protein
MTRAENLQNAISDLIAHLSRRTTLRLGLQQNSAGLIPSTEASAV